MTVAELRQLLTHAGQMLAAGGAKSADEIDYLIKKLGLVPPTQKVKAFADFVEESLKPDPVEAPLAALRALYDRALAPDVTEQSIRDEVNRWCEKLSKPQLDDLARRFELEKKYTRKDQVLKAITQKIIDRKGAFDRAQA